MPNTLPLNNTDNNRDAALGESEHFIEQIANTMPGILYVYDFTERRITYLNRQVSNVLGYSRQEILDMGESFAEALVHPDDLAQFPQWLAKCEKLAGSEIFEHEYRARHKNGEWRWLKSRVNRFQSAAGNETKQILAIAHDITDRRLIEEALRESELRNSAILKMLPDLVFLIHEDGTYLDYHARDEKDLLVPPEVFLGKNFREILPSPVADRISEHLKAAKESDTPQCFEFSLPMNGSEQMYECRVVLNGQDKFLSIVRDVTGQKRTEKALIDSEKRFRAQYRGIPIPTYTWKKTDDDFVLVDFNDEAVCAHNSELKSLLGSKAGEWYADRPEVLESLNLCFTKKQVIEKEETHKTPSAGEVKSFVDTYVFVPPDMVMLHAQDITVRMRAEKALKESEQFNRSIIESSNDCIKILDLEGRLLYLSPKGQELLEMDDLSCIGGEWLGFWNEVDQTVLKPELEKAKAGGTGRFQGFCPTARGTGKWWDVQINPITDAEGRIERLLVISRDITEQKLAAERLMQKESFFRALIEDNHDVISVLRLDGTIVYESSACERILGFRAKERVGHSNFDFIHPDDVTSFRQVFEEAIKNETVYGPVEYRSRHKSGVYKTLEIIGRLSTDDAGERVVIANKRDITERKLAEEKLLQQEKFFRSLIENTHDIVSILRLDGTIAYESPACERILGYKPEDRVGHYCFDHVHPEDLPVVQKAFEEAIETGSLSHPIEYRYLHKDGSYVPLEVIGRGSTDEAGEPVVIVNKRDISERKTMEDKLRTSEELYRDVVETQTELICRYLPDSTLTFVNDAYCRLFGKEREELIGRKFWDLVPEDSLPMAQEFLQSLVTNRTSNRIEHEVIKADGSVGWQEWIDHVIEDAQGNVVELQGIGRDITERKLVAESLRESEERFYSFMNNSPVAAWIDDEDGKILYLNPTYRNSIKLPDEDVTGKTIFEVFPEEIARQYHALIKTALDAKTPDKSILEITRADDSVGTFLTYCFPLTSSKEGKRLIGGFAIDITEQQFFKKALSESEEKYRRIVDAALEGIWTVDAEAKITFANQQLAEMLGYSVEELIGKSVFDFLVDETISRVAQVMEKRREGVSEHYDKKLRRKDGSYLWAMISATPIFDLSGNFTGSLAMITDITERKHAEEALGKSEEMLRGIFEYAPDTMVVVDSRGSIGRVNAQVERMFGYRAEELLGKPVEILIPERFRRQHLQHRDDYVADPHLRPMGAGLNLYGRRKDGSEFPLEIMLSPLVNDPDGMVIAVIRDITERKHAEESLRESRANLSRELEGTKQLQNISSLLIEDESVELLYEQILDAAMAIMDSDFGSLQMLDVQGEKLHLIAFKNFHPESAEYWRELSVETGTTCGAALERGERVIVPDVNAADFVKNSESMNHYRLSGITAVQSTPLKTRGGRLVGMISTHWREVHTPDERELRLLDILVRQAADFFERRRAAEALRESEEKFRTLSEAAPALIWFTDVEGNNLYVNQQYVDFAGKKLEELQGTGWHLNLHPEDAEEYINDFVEAMRERRPYHHRVRIKRHDGEWRWIESFAQPLFSADGTFLGHVGVSPDITVTMEAENALRESEELMRLASEAASMYAWEVDLTSGAVKLSPNVRSALGFEMPATLEEIKKIVHPDDLEKYIEHYQKARLGETPEPFGDYRIINPETGEVVWIRAKSTYLAATKNRSARLVGTTQNITDHKKAEIRLREHQELLQKLVQNLPSAAVTILDRHYRYILAEGKELEKMGLSKGSLRGKFLTDVFSLDNVDYALPFFERAFEGETLSFELSTFGQVYNMWATPMRDQDKHIYAILVMAQNVTEYKQKEVQLQNLSARLLTLQDEERRRLARELHDETGQNLSLMGINFALLREMMSAPAADAADKENVLRLLEDCESLRNNSRREIRTLSYLLHPPMLDNRGLASALQWYIEGFSARSGIHVDFACSVEIGRLRSDIETALYRIVQESLGNIHRHSGSRTARIELTREAGKIILLVKDEGRGFQHDISNDAVESDFSSLGVGILGMRERLRLLGGKLEIASSDRGTTVTAVVPLKHPES